MILPGILEQQGLLTFKEAVLSDNPLAYWEKLDEVDIVNGYNLEIDSQDNPLQTVSRNGYSGTEITGRAILGVVEDPNFASILDNNYTWTAEFFAYYKPPTNNVTQCRFGGDNVYAAATENRISFVEIGVPSGGFESYNNSEDAENMFLHVVAVYSSGGRSITVNNNVIFSGSHNESLLNDIEIFFDDVEVYATVVYDKGLTGTQIETHFNALSLSNPYDPNP